MSTTRDPSTDAETPQPRGPRGPRGASALEPVAPTRRAARLACAVPLLLAAVALFVTWTRLVPTEAALTTDVLDLAFGPGVGVDGDVIWTGIGTDRLFGIELTPLCSTVVLLMPVLFFGGLLVLWLSKAPLWRALVGVAVGVALAVAANQIRFLLLVALWRGFGLGGFQVGHRYVGSIEVLLVFGLAMFAMLRIATGSSKKPSKTSEVAA